MWEVIITGILLGIGLAMDAFAVSVSDGLKESNIKIKKAIFIAFMFALFQLAMPLIGYFVGHAFVSYIDKFIPSPLFWRGGCATFWQGIARRDIGT